MTGPLRNSLIQPPAKAREIVDLFSDAVDALIDGDRTRANELVEKADQPWARDYVERAWGKKDPEIHLYYWNDAYSDREKVPEDQRDTTEDPPPAMKHEVFERDAWHCRYCGIPVLDPEAFEKMRKQDLDALYWGRSNAEQHAGIQLIRGCCDHVEPWCAGGLTNLENLVTACWPCNCAKSDALLEEAGLTDPRQRPPVERNNWDGLIRLLQFRASRHK